ncbi:MAG: acylphosphatase [Chloroflexota bacterium]
MGSRIRAVVQGAVQGVGFRDFIQRRARELGLTGTVRNRPDGTVEVVAEGPPGAVESLQGHLREGPRMASVARVQVTEEPATGEFSEFRVTY